MWLLNLIPIGLVNWAINLILIAGIFLCLMSFFVFNRSATWIPYIGLVQVVSIIMILTGVYFKGSYYTELKWQSKVAETQQKIAIIEQKAAEINVDLAKKTAEKAKVIRVKGDVIYRYIDKEVVKDKEVIKFVEHCPVPSKILELHNAAATNTPIDESEK